MGRMLMARSTERALLNATGHRYGACCERDDWTKTPGGSRWTNNRHRARRMRKRIERRVWRKAVQSDGA